MRLWSGRGFGLEHGIVIADSVVNDLVIGIEVEPDLAPEH